MFDARRRIARDIEDQRRGVLPGVGGGFEDHDTFFREQRRTQQLGEFGYARVG